MKDNKRINVKSLLAVLASLFVLASVLVMTSCNGENKLKYELNGDGTEYTVVGYDGDKGNISIPAEHDGKPVTAIGKSAFDGCVALYEITIPESVKTVEEKAFFACENLEKVNFSGKVKSIGGGAFGGCAALTSFAVPEGIETVNTGTFYNCEALEEISFPSTLKTVVFDAFTGCGILEKITVSEANKNLHARGNCLIDTDEKTLILGGVRCTIPDDGSVTVIGDGAFYTRTALATVSIPKTVKTISKNAFYSCDSLRFIRILGVETVGEYAFYDCHALRYVLVSESLAAIEDYAFVKCPSLNNLYYEGSEDQWNDVSIYKNSGIVDLVKIFFYSETRPESDGNYWRYTDGDTLSPWVNE